MNNTPADTTKRQNQLWLPSTSSHTSLLLLCLHKCTFLIIGGTQADTQMLKSEYCSFSPGKCWVIVGSMGGFLPHWFPWHKGRQVAQWAGLESVWMSNPRLAYCVRFSGIFTLRTQLKCDYQRDAPVRYVFQALKWWRSLGKKGSLWKKISNIKRIITKNGNMQRITRDGLSRLRQFVTEKLYYVCLERLGYPL